MANLKEKAIWENSIYEIAKLDPVLGGEDGVTNKPLLQLANRTLFLKRQNEQHIGMLNPLQISESSQNLSSGAGHSHAIIFPLSSTSKLGIVKLNDTLNSSSNSEALTANQGKKLNDIKVNKSGDTMTGILTVPQLNTPQVRNDDTVNFLTITGGVAQRILTGGVLASNDYTDKSKIPIHGIYAKGNIQTAGAFFGNLQGNASTATRLQTARTISLTGDVSGSVIFDGSLNATTTATLANSGVRAGSYGSSSKVARVTVDGKGRVTNVTEELLQASSTTTAGVVKLNNTLNSTSEVEALTAKQGKELDNKKAEKVHTHTIADITDFKIERIIEHNLNDVKITGQYMQWHTDNSTLQRNYPIVELGLLEVLGAGNLIVQRYTTWQTQRVFTRIFSGNSWSAWVETKAGTLATARRINNVLFDGSQDITIVDNTKVNKSGDTMTGILTVPQLNTPQVRNDDTVNFLTITGGVAQRILTGGVLASNDYTDKSKIPIHGIYAKGNIQTAGAFFGNLQGNASTATRLQTARTISLTGAVTGSVSFDGSSNAQATTRLSTVDGNVVVMSGTVAHGGTIPLPLGFNESQCKWIVSLKDSNPSKTYQDIPEHGLANLFRTELYTTGRKVHALYHYTFDSGGGHRGGEATIEMTVNYLIIGVK